MDGIESFADEKPVKKSGLLVAAMLAAVTALRFRNEHGTLLFDECHAVLMRVSEMRPPPFGVGGKRV